MERPRGYRHHYQHEQLEGDIVVDVRYDVEAVDVVDSWGIDENVLPVADVRP